MIAYSSVGWPDDGGGERRGSIEMIEVEMDGQLCSWGTLLLLVERRCRSEKY